MWLAKWTSEWFDEKVMELSGKTVEVNDEAVDCRDREKDWTGRKMINVSFAFMSIEIDNTISLEDLLTVNSLVYHPFSVASQPLISHTTVHV
jgi:hypothetical protein